MSNANDIRNELRRLNSPLADMSRAMLYEVPKGYFDDLADHITNYSQWANAPEPHTTWPKAMPYEVPQGYFEVLPRALNRKIQRHSDKLPLAKENPHNVPGGYFEALPLQIMQKIKATEEKTKAKTISFKPVWKQVRWAAAAVLLLGIGIGVYNTYYKSRHYDAQAALAGIPQDSISNYVQQNIDEFDMETLAANLEAGDVTSLTNKLSDEEIQNYLDEAGWDESTMNL